MKKIILPIFSLTIAAAMAVSSSLVIAQTTDTEFQNSINKLRQERQAFKDAKNQEMSESQQMTEEKIQAKRQQMEQRRAEFEKKREEHRKNVLLGLIDIQIKHFNKTKERVQKMPKISDALKTELATEIDSAVQKLSEERTKVEGATGQEEIKNLAREIKDLFKTHREIVKKIVDAIHASRAEEAISTAEERAAAVKSKIQDLENEGQDASELDADLENAEEIISDAKEKVEQKKFQDASDDLKKVYQKFRDMAKKVKK